MKPIVMNIMYNQLVTMGFDETEKDMIDFKKSIQLKEDNQSTFQFVDTYFSIIHTLRYKYPNKYNSVLVDNLFHLMAECKNNY